MSSNQKLRNAFVLESQSGPNRYLLNRHEQLSPLSIVRQLKKTSKNRTLHLKSMYSLYLHMLLRMTGWGQVCLKSYWIQEPPHRIVRVCVSICYPFRLLQCVRNNDCGLSITYLKNGKKKRIFKRGKWLSGLYENGKIKTSFKKEVRPFIGLKFVRAIMRYQPIPVHVAVRAILRVSHHHMKRRRSLHRRPGIF